MMMKQNQNKKLRDFFDSLLKEIRTWPFLAAAIAFVLSGLLISLNISERSQITRAAEEFEAGGVADRDIYAEQPITYIDEDATESLVQEALKEVPDVYLFSQEVTKEIKDSFDNFITISKEIFADPRKTSEDYIHVIEEEFPDAFRDDFLKSLYRDSSRIDDLQSGAAALSQIQGNGIFPGSLDEPDKFNRKVVELVRGENEAEFLQINKLVTKKKVSMELVNYLSLREGSYSTSFKDLAPELLLHFLSENVFFSPEDTQRRKDERRSQIKPITRRIERGQAIIRQGDLITSEEAAKLRYINQSLVQDTFPLILGGLIMLCLAAWFLAYLSSKPIAAKRLSNREICLIAAMAVLYLAAAILVKSWTENFAFIPGAAFFPTAWLVMVAAMLLNTPIAASLAMFLPAAAFAAHIYEGQDLVFALISGLAAVSSVQGARRRVDLLKAGLITAGFNCIVIVAQGLLVRAPGSAFPGMLALAFVNGVISGMLVVGALPLVEQALNTATPFRLIELSDLNAPAMQKLLSAAPGTYSHSMMVANLAESACHDIGANSLLARVGAYYHDIGKMDQPDYFIENQTSYNKHSDINPRLSATVIRSHVKIGIEKARQMGLPKEVVDIIGEHHGNSVIQWFYGEALKREGSVNIEDFSYPGNSPRSRESAVVMLADTVEAATRTLKDPGAQRIERYIQELIDQKLDHGQLNDSELTFRDLQTIKKAFVRVLLGFYHNRIEYPKEPGKAEAS
jgi:putative nucleotidyltransferase with HDIG domain